MKTIDDIQREIVEDLRQLGDDFEQYAYLIELSVSKPPLREEKKTDDRAVKGCQSHVWLDLHNEDGVLRFDCDSDTLIIKGILVLLEKIFNGQPMRDAAGADIWFLEKTELMATFDDDRQKGIGYVIRSIKKYASEQI